jgi:D-xylose transport system substrate-binding protein
VPDWDNQQAGTLFEQIYTKQKGDFIGVAAANDGLAGAVVARLETSGEAGKIPVTGQDASDDGLKRVLLGTQCVTIFKDIKNKEATAAADLAVALTTGDTAAADALATGVTKDTKLNKDVKSVLLDPTAITQDNVQEVIDAGQTTADKLCDTDELKKACEEHGVS